MIILELQPPNRKHSFLLLFIHLFDLNARKVTVFRSNSWTTNLRRFRLKLAKLFIIEIFILYLARLLAEVKLISQYKSHFTQLRVDLNKSEMYVIISLLKKHNFPPQTNLQLPWLHQPLSSFQPKMYQIKLPYTTDKVVTASNNRN